MKTIAVLILLLLAGAAQAQLRKCVAPDGRVTYSDVLCSTEAAAGTIKNPNGNTLDTSGLRNEARAMQAAKDDAEAKERLANERRNVPLQDCKFLYFAIGDSKGQKLAANAKAECLRNNQARLEGREISLEHYNFWKDHRSLTSAERQAAATRNAVNNKTYDCTPNIGGRSLNCR